MSGFLHILGLRLYAAEEVVFRARWMRLGS